MVSSLLSINCYQRADRISLRTAWVLSTTMLLCTTLDYAALYHTTVPNATLQYATLHHNNNNNNNNNNCNYTTLNNSITLQLPLQLHYTTLHPAVVVRWPLQPLQPLQQTQLQPPFSPSVDSLCHPWFTSTNLSYRFPILKLPPPACAVLLV